MNVGMLKVELERLNVPKDMYHLTGGLPNESYCIGQRDSKWDVYYSERGRKSDLKTFDDESTACEYFLDLMKHVKTST